MYKDGLTDFSHIIDAQRSLFIQEDQLAESGAEITRDLIRLYKALGGGGIGRFVNLNQLKNQINICTHIPLFGSQSYQSES
ncbi:MAG: hypothetical protein H8E41_13690 [Desulfobulbaceae bacterium]|uniref:Uncharacterized protein n=1 Tax=Candidatus Desulfobia pelagia TaxID=2841692 RepID=A0A8J6NI87_9BACT|nr:hypothetical protein [Candidatus Desulfobia pelagia]